MGGDLGRNTQDVNDPFVHRAEAFEQAVDIADDARTFHLHIDNHETVDSQFQFDLRIGDRRILEMLLSSDYFNGRSRVVNVATHGVKRE